MTLYVISGVFFVLGLIGLTGLFLTPCLSNYVGDYVITGMAFSMFGYAIEFGRGSIRRSIPAE
jgi:hypothetical protein